MWGGVPPLRCLAYARALAVWQIEESMTILVTVTSSFFVHSITVQGIRTILFLIQFPDSEIFHKKVSNYLSRCN